MISHTEMLGGSGACSQWCSRKYLGTGAVQNVSGVVFLEREH